jgi:ATP-dependent RNA helicase DeaD
MPITTNQQSDQLSSVLPGFLAQSLHNSGIKEFTSIQKQAIPSAIEGRDLLAIAPTGTGKTLAFLIPTIARMTKDQSLSGVILTPTRELASQIHRVAQTLLHQQNIRPALLIGGASMHVQIRQLNKSPRLIIGTPGRINDHITRGYLTTLPKTQLLVLDETDQMLDMGFLPQIKTIVDQLPSKRQTFLFSATMPRPMESLTQKFLNEPKNIRIGQVFKPNDQLSQQQVYVKKDNKLTKLLSIIQELDGSIIVFVKTKMAAEQLKKQIDQDGQSVDTIHGNLHHGKRERVLNRFRQNRFRILIGTDVVSRGLDIPHVNHVINYDLPQSREDYMHRIGRTARAGASGTATTFVTNDNQWQTINPENKTPPPPIKRKKPFKHSRSSSHTSRRSADSPARTCFKSGKSQGQKLTSHKRTYQVKSQSHQMPKKTFKKSINKRHTSY